MVYKVVVDLEMCKVARGLYGARFPMHHEIIQIGAVLMDDANHIIDKFDTFVHPQFGKLDSFISELTGIYEGQVKFAPVLADAMQMFVSWIGDKEVKIYAWSKTDYSQLSRELNCKHIDLPGLSELMEKELWVDYQEVFDSRYEIGRSVALKDALYAAKVDEQGRLHDALNDAYNTALLIERIENEPEKAIDLSYLKAGELVTEGLSVTLGDLFANLLQQAG